MKNLLILPLLFLACALHGQTKPDTTPSIKLSQSETMAVIARIDSTREAVYRSAATQPERNWITDRLKELEQFFIAKFNEQNPPKKEEVKIEPKKP